MKKILYILPLIFLFACETTIPVDLPEVEDKLVINALLSPDNVQPLELTATLGILDTNKEFPRITTATIEAYEGETKLGTFTHLERGLYQPNFTPKENKTYTIKAQANGFPTATCTFTTLTAVPIKNASVKQKRFEVTFDDPKDTENFYIIAAYYIEDNEWSSGRRNVSLELDELSENRATSINLNDYGYGYLMADGYLDGEEISIKGELWLDDNSIDEVHFELYSVSKAMYRYLKSKENQVNIEDNPFAQAVTVYTNIENGLGIVNTYTIYTETVKLKN